MWLSSAARTLIDVKQRQIRQQQQRQQNSDDKETKKDKWRLENPSIRLIENCRLVSGLFGEICLLKIMTC